MEGHMDIFTYASCTGEVHGYLTSLVILPL